MYKKGYITIMKKLIIYLLISAGSIGSSVAQDSLRINLAATASSYHSWSIGFSQMFPWGKFRLGPSADYCVLTRYEEYQADGESFLMDAQLRINLVNIEYPIGDRVSVGVSPFWLLAPLPRRGYYKIPSSIYARFEIYNNLFYKAVITNTDREFMQMSLIKRF